MYVTVTVSKPHYLVVNNSNDKLPLFFHTLLYFLFLFFLPLQYISRRNILPINTIAGDL